MTPKERITKHKASVKKHFLAKRLAKAKASNSNTASAPKHKATPSTTAGKTVSYFGDKARVTDLGHEPSKSAIAGAVSSLRKARAATTPKATTTPPSAAKAPEIKLTTAAKATTPNPQATTKSSAGFVAGGAAVAAAGAATLAMKKRAPNHAGKGELKLTGAKAELAAANTAKTRGPEIKAAKQATLTAQRDKRASTAKAAEHKPISGRAPSPKDVLAGKHLAQNKKKGTEIRHAREAFARADVRAAAKPTTNIISLGKNPSPLKIAEARAKGRPTPATQETSMAEPVQDARAKAAIAKATKGFTDPATAVQKSTQRAGDRRQGDTTRRAPTRATKANAGRPDAVAQKSNRRKKGSDPRGAKIETVKTTPTTGAPKPVDLSSGGQAPITRTAAPNVAQVPKGAVATGTPSKAKATPDGGEPKAIKLTGAQRQSANQAARAAMRSGDAVAMRKALATLPETGKKAIKYRKNLEAGIESAGHKPAAAPKVDKKLAHELKVEQAKNAKLKAAAAAPADAGLLQKELAAAKSRKPKSGYKQRKQNFRDRENRIEPKTGKPMQLPQDTRTPKEIEAHKTRNLMETTIDESRITPERDAAEARERANKMGQEARTELVVRESQEAGGKKGKAPTPTGQEPANRGQTEAVAKAAVKSPEAPRVTENEAAHQKQQRYNAEGRQTENVNIKEVAKQVQENAKLGQADNMRQKMARGAADAVLKQAAAPTSAAKPKAISLTSQSSTPAPKVSKADAYRNYEALKETGVKSPTAAPAKPKAQAPAKTDKAQRAPLKPKGEQLPRAQAKGRVIPSKADMLAEQGKADTSPPKTPAKSRPPINKPSPFTFADSIRKYANTVVKGAKGLTNPAIGSNTGANIKAGIKGGALLAGLFALADAGVAGASENDPSKRAGKAAEAFKESAPKTAAGVAGYTAAAAATKAIAGRAVAGAVFGAALPAYLTYKTAKEFTIPMLKSATSEYAEAKYAKNAAAREKKGSEAKYGTVAQATKTRHAKEAVKKKQRDLLTGGK